MSRNPDRPLFGQIFTAPDMALAIMRQLSYYILETQEIVLIPAQPPKRPPTAELKTEARLDFVICDSTDDERIKNLARKYRKVIVIRDPSFVLTPPKGRPTILQALYGSKKTFITINAGDVSSKVYLVDRKAPSVDANAEPDSTLIFGQLLGKVMIELLLDE